MEWWFSNSRDVILPSSLSYKILIQLAIPSFTLPVPVWLNPTYSYWVKLWIQKTNFRTSNVLFLFWLITSYRVVVYFVNSFLSFLGMGGIGGKGLPSKLSHNMNKVGSIFRKRINIWFSFLKERLRVPHSECDMWSRSSHS